jgi:hypothetical protein
VEDLLDDAFLVHGEVEGEAHARIGEEAILAAGVELVLGPGVEIDPAVELLRAARHLDAGLATEHAGVDRRHGVDEADLARPERGEASTRLGDDLEAQLLEERGRAPVAFVALEAHRVAALPADHLPRAGAHRPLVERLHSVLDGVLARDERLAADDVPQGRQGLARVDAHGVLARLLPARDRRVHLLEGGGGGDVLDSPAVEVLPEHPIEIEEHGVGVEGLAVVEGDAAPKRELPREIAHRLPAEGEAGHRLALGVHVDEALVDLADIVRSGGAHAEARVHVGRVVGHRHHQLGVRIDGGAVESLGPARGRGQRDDPAHQTPRRDPLHRAHRLSSGFAAGTVAARASLHTRVIISVNAERLLTCLYDCPRTAPGGSLNGLLQGFQVGGGARKA